VISLHRYRIATWSVAGGGEAVAGDLPRAVIAFFLEDEEFLLASEVVLPVE